MWLQFAALPLQHVATTGVFFASERGISPVILDPIAATVWRSLDGTTTIAALAKSISDAIHVSQDEALTSITRLIDGLAEVALVSWDEQSPDPSPAPSSDSSGQLHWPAARSRRRRCAAVSRQFRTAG